MHVFVIRHGIAEDPRPDLDDTARALTAEGERKVRRAVRGLRRLGWQLDRVLSSPWARAWRTAELLAPISNDDPVATDMLCAPPRPELLAMIAERPPAKNNHATGVVGHEPWLGELVALLAFGDAKLGESILLKKAGAVWLEGTPAAGGMTIRAVLPPTVLRRMRS